MLPLKLESILIIPRKLRLEQSLDADGFLSPCTWCKLRWIQSPHSSDCATCKNEFFWCSIHFSAFHQRHGSADTRIQSSTSKTFLFALFEQLLITKACKDVQLKVSSLSALFSSDCFTWIIILHFRNFSLLFFLHFLYTDYSKKNSFTHRWSHSICF